MISLLDDWRVPAAFFSALSHPKSIEPGPVPTLPNAKAQPTSAQDELGVGSLRQVELLTDEHLQQWIDYTGRQLLAANDKLQIDREPYFALRGDVAHWERLQREALLERGRRLHIVAQMEAERDLT